MSFLISIGVWFYFFGLHLLYPFSDKARRMIRGRREQFGKGIQPFPADRKVIWFHAASLGEFEQGRPLLEAWKKSKPEDYLLLTFFSSSGYENRKDYPFADRICYLPFDSSRHLKKFIRLAQPALLVLIKYEFWPRLLRLIRSAGVPVYLVSATFRSDQHFFKWYGFFFRSLLKGFRQIFVQDSNSRELLNRIGLTQVQLAGDTRVDRVLKIAAEKEEVPGIEAFVGDDFVLVAGSSWAPEEGFIHRLLRSERPELSHKPLKVLLAPHDVGEDHLKKIEELFGSDLIRYSSWIRSPNPESVVPVLLIDQIGLLNRLYRYGQIALVGGGFGRGLHNILEPAAYGIPVLFGPRHRKFPEAQSLIETGGGKSLSSYPDFEEIMANYMSDIKSLSTGGAGSLSYVNNSKGATALVINYLMENR